MRYGLLFICLFFYQISFTQTFSGTGGAIPDDGNSIVFEIPVSGLPAVIDTQSFGITQICLDIYHTWNADLYAALVAPDGTSVLLFSGIGGDTDGFLNTCLACDAPTSIYEAPYPYTGAFRPLGELGLINNQQNPNGVWKLFILDTYAFADEGGLNNWSITFGNVPCKPFLLESSDLPIVKINTLGQVIPDEPKIDAVMTVIDNGPGNRNYPEQDNPFYTGPIGIEVHGNSSQGFPKKTYRIETRDASGDDADVALMGLPETSDYVLSANFSDKTLMRNALTYDLTREMGQYASRTRFCEVLLNGTYQGVYILTERIKRGSNHVDVAKLKEDDLQVPDITGGYILRLDRNSTPGWYSLYSQPNGPNTYTYFQFDYPRWDLVQPAQLEYIHLYVDSFETALISPQFQSETTGWRRFGDETSFIDFLIINELSKNVDGYRLSTYLHKNRNDIYGKLKMGPVWDFDLGWLNADYCDAWLPSGWAYNLNYVCQDAGIPFWWERLMADPKFRQNLSCRWNILRNGPLHLDQINSKIDSMATVLQESQERNFKIWPILGTYVWPNPGFLPDTYSGEVDKLKTWVSDRINWMDDEIASFQPALNANFITHSDGFMTWTFTPVATVPGLTYTWDFGDGNTATMTAPAHAYTTTGEFTVTLQIATAFGCTATSTQTIIVGTSGTQQASGHNLFITPNPASDHILINLGKNTSAPVTVTFLNTLGQKVTQTTTIDGKVSLADLAPGTYQIVVEVNGQTQVGKIVKI